MSNVDFISVLHTSTKRDYIKRVTDFDKAACAEIAIKWGQEYWDGPRQYGYGGMKYDGRWRKVAQAMVDHYKLKPDAKILDIGCGKGFLLYEFTQILPKAHVAGLDISKYGIENAKEEVRPFLKLGNAVKLPYPDKSFDYVYSITTFHNLLNFELWAALKEMQRVSKGPAYLVVESYRNEREKANLLYWQLTCRSFYSVKEWEWIYKQTGYTGDYSFIYFE